MNSVQNCNRYNDDSTPAQKALNGLPHTLKYNHSGWNAGFTLSLLDSVYVGNKKYREKLKQDRSSKIKGASATATRRLLDTAPITAVFLL